MDTEADEAMEIDDTVPNPVIIENKRTSNEFTVETPEKPENVTEDNVNKTPETENTGPTEILINDTIVLQTKDVKPDDDSGQDNLNDSFKTLKQLLEKEQDTNDNKVDDIVNTVSDDDDLEIIEIPSDSVKKKQNSNSQNSVKGKKKEDDDCVVILIDDEDESASKTEKDKLAGKNSKRKIEAEATEVIDLVPKKKNSGNNKCINYACQSGLNMVKAPVFCLSYYRVKNTENKCLEVCQECFEEAFMHYDKLATALIDGKLLVQQEIPVRDDMFEIDDSDSEDEADKEVKEYFNEEGMQFLKENLDEVINETIEKYKMKEQVEESVKFLVEKQDQLKVSYAEVDNMIRELRKCLDGVQRNIYSEFKVRYQHLSPLDIKEAFYPSPRPVIRSPMTLEMARKAEAERRNSRKPKQPITFVELDEPTGANNSSSEADNSTSKAPDEKLDDVIEVPPDLPPKGPIVKPEPVVGENYYAVRFLTMGSWMQVRLLNIFEPGSIVNGQPTTQRMYCVSMENNKQKNASNRLLTGKEMAYCTAPEVQLEVGTRVIAVFKEVTTSMEMKKPKKDTYFPGIVAEPLSAANRYRYLIFFDDGYAQYVNHSQVHLVFDASKDVWEDVHIDSRSFIKKYLEMYPERPMVKLRKDQTVRTEYKGRWWLTTVMNIDCSLVQMFFDSSSRIEWIYRGSTRLNPMFKEEQAASNRQHNKTRIMPRILQKGGDNSGAYVEYTRNEEGKKDTESQAQPPAPIRAVARKSTAKAMVSASSKVLSFVSTVPFLPVAPKEQQKETTTIQTPPPTKVVYFTPRAQTNLRAPYRGHVCSPRCKRYVLHNVNKLNSYNPLAKPLLCGWNRIIYKNKGRKEVNYKTPCGRFVRDMHELHLYLRLTDSEMTVDLFDFDYWVHCLAEFMLEKDATINKDLSNGLEIVPIPVVNYTDNKMNDFCNYSTKREPMEGVNLNLDPEFLSACDCDDDCADRSKCQCWQLTLEGLSYLQKDISPDQVGYQYRRLPEAVPTGIYECNSRCKCGRTCLNRVVQNPLQLKLQVFKTTNRGWGIRCLNDIPQGAFICIYAGSILTEQMANEGGKNYGDEYLAELDYIEVVEKMKEDYEEEAMLDEEDLKDDSRSRDNSDNEEEEVNVSTRGRKKNYSDDQDFVPNINLDFSSSIRTRLRRRHTEEDQKQDNKAENGNSNSSNSSRRRDSEDKDKTEKGKEEEEAFVTISDDEDGMHEPSSFNPMDESRLDETRPSKYKSVRELFGKDESVYVMDAKVTGNIGRFLNHSCSPNVFVQNVFVDTHDLRFPWVAFFALSFIRAGTELTWNYNYDVGSVPGKTMYCYCASAECRGRLL